MSQKNNAWRFHCLYLINTAIVLGFWLINLRGRLQAGNTNSFIEAGRLSGLLGTYGTLIQFIFLSGAPWVERGLGFDRLTRIHKYNGLFIGLCILSHPIFLSIGYGLRDDECWMTQFVKFVGWQGIPLALVAYGLFIIVGFSSMRFMRKFLKYEIWHAIHLSVYAAIVLAFWHQIYTGSDFTDSRYFKWYWIAFYATSLGIYLCYHWIRPWRLYFKHRFYLKKIVAETPEVTSYYIQGRALEKFRIQSGQFIFLRFLKKGFWTQSHPFSFSLSKGGHPTPNKGEGLLRVTVKALGDFTKKMPGLKPNTPVLIDGPLGIFTCDRSSASKVLAIAGGIGITPIRSVTESFLELGNPVGLLYASQSWESTALREELEGLQRKFGHFDLRFIISRDSTGRFEKGPVDSKLIKRYYPDVAQRDIYLCGPPAMMEVVIAQLKQLGVPKKHIHFERFSL